METSTPCVTDDAPVRMFENHPRRLRIIVGAVGFVLLAASPLSAASFRATSTAAGSGGVCGPAPGECRLREAILAAVDPVSK